MGRLEVMESESDCVEAIFVSYSDSKNTKDIFMFFEGNDDFKYYICRISQYIGNKEYAKYTCQSKKNVLEVYNMICKQSSIRDGQKNLYFIDSDYDCNDDVPKDIYVTTSYSIENYYFTDSAIRKVLIAKAGLSEEKREDRLDLEKILRYITEERNKIIEEIIYANAWYSLQMKKSKIRSNIPILSTLKNISAIREIHQICQLESQVYNSIDVTESEILEEINNIRKSPVNRIRGKYLLQALLPMFRNIFMDAGKKEGRKWFTVRRHVQPNLVDILSEFSAYADTPQELINYLEGKFHKSKWKEA